MGEYRIVADDLHGEEVVALLRFHLDEMHRWSPPESCHVMPVERLRQPDVHFYSAWDGDRLAAVGAIRHLEDGRGELKSMRATPACRGKGAGRAILAHLIGVARERGYRWIGLETGTPAPFDDAFRLYSRAGFVEVEPFGDYRPDPYSRFMALNLSHTLPAVTCRDAMAGDGPALAALGRDSFVAAFGHLYRSEDLNAFLQQAYSIDAVAAELADPAYTHRLALAADGSLAAFVKIRHPGGYGHSDAHNPLTLCQLYTDPARTGQGMGGVLMQWVLDQARARGCDAIQLSVWSENLRAQKFYQRHGFAKIADIHFMVGQHRDDEFLYELRL